MTRPATTKLFKIYHVVEQVVRHRYQAEVQARTEEEALSLYRLAEPRERGVEILSEAEGHFVAPFNSVVDSGDAFAQAGAAASRQRHSRPEAS